MNLMQDLFDLCENIKQNMYSLRITYFNVFTYSTYNLVSNIPKSMNWTFSERIKMLVN